MFESKIHELLENNNIVVNTVDLPVYIKGLTVKKIDYYIILLNCKFNDIQQRKTLLHELKHIELGHLELNDLASQYLVLENEVYNYNL